MDDCEAEECKSFGKMKEMLKVELFGSMEDCLVSSFEKEVDHC